MASCAHGAHAVTAAEVEALLAKLEAQAPLSAAECATAANIIQAWAHVQERLGMNDLTLAALRRLLGMPPALRAAPRSGSGGSGQGAPQTSGAPALTAAGGAGAEGEDAEDGADTPAASSNRDPHGRRDAEAMAPLQHQHHPHPHLSTGCLCPGCKKGRLYRFEPRVFTSIVGQAPLVGVRHTVDRLRCNHCKKLYAAPLPHEVAQDIGPGQLYAYSAQTMVVIHKYFGAMPWYRQALLQAAIGIEVPDASMWHMCERLANLFLPISRALTKHAAQAPLLQGDDTSVTILEHRVELRAQRRTGQLVERTGAHTTCIIATTAQGQVITLFQVGIQHAGEMLDHVLRLRDKELPAPLFVADAGSANTPTVCEVHACGCNAHALRRFKDIRDLFPEPCDHVLKLYGRIFEHDHAIAMAGLDDGERLDFHRTFSRPLLREICVYADTQLRAGTVEPNTPLSEAFNYVLNHEHELAAFCRYPGVPLDNTRVERALKLPIRLRDVPGAFKNIVGAKVAQTLWTVGGTALAADENVFVYFNALQRHPDDVRANPTLWFPWNFRERLSKLEPTTGPPMQQDTAAPILAMR